MKTFAHTVSELTLLLLYGFTFFVLFFFSKEQPVSLWVMMEVLTLFFFGFTLVVSKPSNSTSNLIYFLFQSSLSIFILISFTLGGNKALMVGLSALLLLVKLGFSPYSSLFLHSLKNLPIPSLFMALTFQKIPPCLILGSVIESAASCAESVFNVLTLLVVLTASVPLQMNFFTSSLKDIIIISSLFNSTWLIMASLTTLDILFCYFLVYSVSLYFILFKAQVMIPLFNLMGLPPLPLFFVKLLIVLHITTLFTSGLFLCLLLLMMVANVVMLSIYFSWVSAHTTLAT